MLSGNKLVADIAQVLKQSEIEEGVAVTISLVLADDTHVDFLLTKNNGEVEVLIALDDSVDIPPDVPFVGTA